MLEYLITINLITMILFGIDKYNAIHKNRRIPEKVLLFMGIAGGSLGGIIGMILFHHKTKKLKFIISYPLLLLINIILIIYLK